MRAHLNDRAKSELLEIMAALGETSTSHTLNKLITQMHKQIVNAPTSEVINNDQCSTDNH